MTTTICRPWRIDQTVFASDLARPGNCVAACVASYLGLPLDQVPHFLELGEQADLEVEDRTAWWFYLVGFMAGHALWPVELDDVDGGHPRELLFVAGPSPRGVAHQVLYMDGELWHDPHPSRAGILDVREVLAWRPARFDHTPTPGSVQP